jgi:hypothetical protein
MLKYIGVILKVILKVLTSGHETLHFNCKDTSGNSVNGVYGILTLKS